MNANQTCFLISLVIYMFSSVSLDASIIHFGRHGKSKKRQQNSSLELERRAGPIAGGLAPIGISNSGNSCYASSVMQLLMLLKEPVWQNAMRRYFSDGDSKVLPQEEEFLKQVFDFRKSWISGNASPRSNGSMVRKIITTGIKNNIYWWENSHGQQDATEFFQGISQFLGATDPQLFKLVSTIRFMHNGAPQKTTRHEEIPSGIELPLFSLSGQPGEPVTIHDMAATYFAAESLTGENQYDYEGQKYDATKQLHLSGNADYLFVSLKRFYVDERLRLKKSITKVDLLDGTLNLESFIIDSNEDTDLFEIVGISMHAGTTNGGHYTARVKYGRHWYVADDDSIRETSWDEVRRSAREQAYLLLLKRVRSH